jgi:hypothetical protein
MVGARKAFGREKLSQTLFVAIGFWVRGFLESGPSACGGGGKEGIERKREEQGIGVCVGVGEWERWAGKGEGRVDNVALGI